MTRPRLVVVALLALLAALPSAAQAGRRDRDHDHMPDRWERHFRLRLGVKDGRRDRDHDGLSNLREYRRHTNPRRRDTDRDGIADGRDRRPRHRDARRSARASGSRSQLTSVGSALLGDEQAAERVRRTGWEPRPANARANHTVPSGEVLARFYAASSSWEACEPLKRRITGNFTGTTDEIIQWAAWKWGLDEDVVRAEAVVESSWDQHGTPGDGGVSFGLMQIKSTVSRGTAPLSSDSTAFNLDYYGATLRYYYDGCATWLSGGYSSGDMWGAIGAWFSGGWHDAGAADYIARVRRELARRAWARAGF